MGGLRAVLPAVDDHRSQSAMRGARRCGAMMDIVRSWLACSGNPTMSLASHTDVDARHAMPPWAIIAPCLPASALIGRDGMTTGRQALYQDQNSAVRPRQRGKDHTSAKVSTCGLVNPTRTRGARSSWQSMHDHCPSWSCAARHIKFFNQEGGPPWPELPHQEP